MMNGSPLLAYVRLHSQELGQVFEHFYGVLLVAHLRPGLRFVSVGVRVQPVIDTEHQIADLTVVLPVGFLG